MDDLSTAVKAALVYVQVYIAGEKEPRPGTAFVVQRYGTKAYLLTAWHVLHPDDGRASVQHIHFRGGGVDERDTDQVSGLEDAARREDDIVLFHLDAQPNGPKLPLGHPEAELGGADSVLAIGFATAADHGPLPEPTKKPGVMGWTKKQGGRDVLTSTAEMLTGMSGGPVLQTSTGQILGVVRGRRESEVDASRDGLVAPVSALAEALKYYAGLDLPRQVAPSGLEPLPVPCVNRPEEQRIHALLDAPVARFVVLTGPGGTGKTTLASKIAWERLRRGLYPDGIFLVRVNHRPLSQVLAELVVRVTRSRRPIPGSSTEVAAFINGKLRGRRVLVILDDLRDDTIAPELLQALAETQVLASSRRRYADPRVVQCEVGSLSKEQARELLRGKFKALGHPDPDMPTVDRLSQRLGYHALALSLAAGAMGALQLSPAEFLSRFERAPLLTLESAERNPVIHASLSLSLEKLGSAELKLVTLLGLLGEAPVPAALLAGVLGGAPLEAQLNELVLRSLLSRVDADQFEMHPIIYEFLKERAEKAWSARCLRKKLIKWLVKEGSRDVAPHEWRPSLAQHVLAAQKGAVQAGQMKEVFSLASAWGSKLVKLGPWAVREELWRNAVKAARAGKKPMDLQRALSELANALSGAEKWEEAKACWQESLAINRQGADSGLIWSMMESADDYEPVGSVRCAVLEEALQMARKLADSMIVQIVILRLEICKDDETRIELLKEAASMRYRLGQDRFAAEALHRASRIAESNNDLFEARALREESQRLCHDSRERDGNFLCWADIDRFSNNAEGKAKARAMLEKQIALFRQHEKTSKLGSFLKEAGFSAKRLAVLGLARRLWEESLAIYQESGTLASQRRVSLELAGLMRDLRDDAAAQRLAQQGLETARSLGDRRWYARCLFQLIGAAQRQADYGTAQRLVEEALGIESDRKDPIVTIWLLQQLGRLALLRQDRSAAKVYLQQSQNMLDQQPEHSDRRFAYRLEMQVFLMSRTAETKEALSLLKRSFSPGQINVYYEKDRRGRAEHLRDLAELAQESRALDLAIKFVEDSLALYRKENDLLGLAQSLEQLGLLQRDSGDLKAAHSSLMESLSGWKEFEYPPAIARILNEMAEVAAKDGDAEGAHRYHDQALVIFPQMAQPSRK